MSETSGFSSACDDCGDTAHQAAEGEHFSKTERSTVAVCMASQCQDHIRDFSLLVS